MPSKYKLIYLKPASNDFEEIVKFHLNEAGKESARKIYGIMRTALLQLEDYPLMGQLHPDPLLAAEDFRKLVLTKTYVAVYKVEGDTVFIYRIVNGRTNYPALLR